MRIRTRTLRIAATAALIAFVPAAAGAGAALAAGKKAPKPVTKTVQITDNLYTPAKLTVPVNSTIVWKWPVTTGDTHDVTLDKGPKGVKKFQSEIAASEYTYKQKLKVSGKYHIICTLHEEMTMDITVR